MTFLIDTDVLSALRKPRKFPQVGRWVGARSPTSLFLSSITVGEIARGIWSVERHDPGKASALRKWLGGVLHEYSNRVLEFDTDAALRWGELTARLGYESADLQIAAIALTRGLSVVTRNVADFRPTGVPVVNPFEE